MKRRYKNDIERYGSDILNSDELQHAYDQTHHTWSTVGEHTLRVAAASLAICYALRKIHVSTDTSAVVKVHYATTSEFWDGMININRTRNAADSIRQIPSK